MRAHLCSFRRNQALFSVAEIASISYSGDPVVTAVSTTTPELTREDSIPSVSASKEQAAKLFQVLSKCPVRCSR